MFLYHAMFGKGNSVQEDAQPKKTHQQTMFTATKLLFQLTRCYCRARPASGGGTDVYDSRDLLIG